MNGNSFTGIDFKTAKTRTESKIQINRYTVPGILKIGKSWGPKRKDK
jgi:riboflavin synthase